ncbi:MAG: hypothetical protein H6728_12075 [Myxococcales bacterium]|nr:hypothetical protein [Myxococcales bacterium]
MKKSILFVGMFSLTAALFMMPDQASAYNRGYRQGHRARHYRTAPRRIHRARVVRNRYARRAANCSAYRGWNAPHCRNLRYKSHRLTRKIQRIRYRRGY